MLIKYMDELAQSGRFDLKTDGDVNVYLVELKGFTEDKGLAEWEIAGEATVPRSQLHYDDTADGSNALNGSWREFYAAGCDFGQRALYGGSNIFYKDGSPNFGGVAKAVIYLRHAAGFSRWLEVFDATAAAEIQLGIPSFEKLVDNPSTKKLVTAWVRFKAPKGKWAVPVICRFANGRKLVFGLSGTVEDDWDDLEALGVDVPRSLELMSFIDAPKAAEKQIISDLFQMSTGTGRNAFGKNYDIGKISDSEYTRLMGAVTKTSRSQVLDIWTDKLEYRGVEVAPNPKSSKLIFMPEGELPYSQLKRFVDSENNKRTEYFEAKKQKKTRGNEDAESLRSYRPSAIPVPTQSLATLFLVNIEDGQKKKLVVQQVFPAVSLGYLACLNAELLGGNTQGTVVGYMKAALTCQDRDTPSVYRYWTTVFTSALQMGYISANEVFHCFQRFCKAFDGEELVGKDKKKDKGKAREYFRVVARLRRLQHLIHAARETPERLNTIEFNNELKLVEQYELTTKGVFSMNQECPGAAELAGEVHELLTGKQKAKLDAFVRQSWQGVPSDDFTSFVRGALVGILLNELCYCVQKSGRSFSVTQGRHPSTLRGEQIQALVAKGVGLLVNLGEQHRFNCNTLPFINSCLAESRKDVFNSGLIMGLVFIHKTQEKEA